MGIPQALCGPGPGGSGAGRREGIEPPDPGRTTRAEGRPLARRRGETRKSKKEKEKS